MTVVQATRRGVATAVALGALLASALEAPAAHAEVVTFSGGHANWGLKQSFRDYIETGPADGEITVAGGTIRNDDGTFRFPVDGGSYDTIAGAGTIDLRGSVHVTGHHGSLAITISDPRIEVDDDTGTLIADISSRSLDNGTTEEYPDAELADLDLAAAGPTSGDQRLTWAASPARLAAGAAPVFESFYAVGELLDPLDTTASYGEPSVAPAAPVLTTAPPTPSSTRNLRIAGAAPAGTTVKLYRGAGCKGLAFATTAAAELADPGVAVTVPSNSTTTFSATSQTQDSASACSSPVSYTHVGQPPDDPRQGGDDNGGTTPPVAPAKRASVTFAKRAQLNVRTRVARVATVRCPTGPCKVSASKTVRIKIAGKWFRAGILVPKRIAGGKSAHVRVKLSRTAAMRLEGRVAKLKLRLVVRAADGRALPHVRKLKIARTSR